MSSNRFSTQSETPSRVSRRSLLAGPSSIPKSRTISNASLISDVSNATTVTPQNVSGGDTLPSGVNSAHAKRMSTSIPTLSAIRRQSAPVQGFISNSRSTSLLSSPVISTSTRAMPTTLRDSPALKASPSVAGSIRTARSSNNLRAAYSPPQNAEPFPPSTPRSRVVSMSTPAELSESSATSLSVSSPSINLTTPSPQSSRIKPSPQQSSPRAIHSKPPSRKSSAAYQANRRSQNRQNGSVRSTISISTPPRQLDFHQVNGDEAFASSMSIWDGDDMTLDMITEAGDENVDEEVSTVYDVV